MYIMYRQQLQLQNKTLPKKNQSDTSTYILTISKPIQGEHFKIYSEFILTKYWLI